MYQHHRDSIEKLKEYFWGREGVSAIVLDGSIVKGTARPDSDVDAVVVVTVSSLTVLYVLFTIVVPQDH